MNLNPATVLDPVFHFLDWILAEYGVYLFLAFAWLSLLVLAWVFSGGLRRKFPNQPHVRLASAFSFSHTHLHRQSSSTNMACRMMKWIENKRSRRAVAAQAQASLAMGRNDGRLRMMNEAIDIRLIEGRQRAEDMRRLAAGEVTPEQLQQENAIVQSAADILKVDFSPKGTDEQWARIISDLERD